MPTFLISCGGITYTLFANGTGEKDDIRFNVKHIKDGCCVCSGVLVNSFKNDEIQSQLFVESKNRFLFNSTKFYFPYSINDSLIKVDVMIAVVNTPFQYPVLISTKLR